MPNWNYSELVNAKRNTLREKAQEAYMHYRTHYPFKKSKYVEEILSRVMYGHFCFRPKNEIQKDKMEELLNYYGFPFRHEEYGYLVLDEERFYFITKLKKLKEKAEQNKNRRVSNKTNS